MLTERMTETKRPGLIAEARDGETMKCLVCKAEITTYGEFYGFCSAKCWTEQDEEGDEKPAADLIAEAKAFVTEYDCAIEEGIVMASNTEEWAECLAKYFAMFTEKKLAEADAVSEERKRLIDVFKRNIAMHGDGVVQRHPELFPPEQVIKHAGFVDGLKRGLEILEWKDAAEPYTEEERA